jgi:hypothetical protein
VNSGENNPIANGTGTGATLFGANTRILGLVGDDMYVLFRRNATTQSWWMAKFSMVTSEFTILSTSDTTMIPSTGYISQELIGLPYYFMGPNAVCQDRCKNMYVLRQNPSAIYRINTTANRIQTIANGPTVFPRLVGVGPDGTLYCIDTSNLKFIYIYPSPV